MKCVVCDSREFQFLLKKHNYRIEKCSTCGLVQVTNMPTQDRVHEAYDRDFFEVNYAGLTNNPGKQGYVYLNFENKLDQIEKRIGAKGKILDVGCSFGFFLDAARWRGWKVTGVEVSEYAAKYAIAKLGLTVINGPIGEAKVEENSFDVITMWYVAEHLRNPKQVLGRLSNFLKDDGMLVVSTPNVDSYRAKIEGGRWRIWIPPVHLLYFSPLTIRTLFKTCNLEVVDQETSLPYEKYFRKFKLYGLVNKLKVSDNVIYYVKKRGNGVNHSVTDVGRLPSESHRV